eukprot:g1762.t1
MGRMGLGQREARRTSSSLGRRRGLLARGRRAPSGEGDLKVAVASYNILLDLQISTNSAPYMKTQCMTRASREQCLTNSGSLIAKYKKEGKPPIALLGVQEYKSPGKAPFLKGLGADWKLLTSHITCGVWYNEALVPNAKAPSAASVGNENDGPLVFLKKGLTGTAFYWDSDRDGVRCAVAGYFPDQRLLFGSLWCVHPGTVAGEHCIKKALSRFQKLADANEWKEYDRVIITMDSNDGGATLLAPGSKTGWPLKTPSGKDLTLRISSKSLKTCCYSSGPLLQMVGDYIADTAEPDTDSFIVPGAVSNPVGLRSDHVPVMKNVLVPVGGVVSPSAPPAASGPEPENSKPEKENLKKATNVPEGITETFAVRGDELLSSGTFHLAAIPEPTHGSVQYVNEPDLLFKALPETKQGKLIMDNKWTGTGYKSFRFESKARFGPGTVILWDAERVPVGHGTWPAYWSTDAATWPNAGEIDMMEAVNMDTKMRSTLHTGTRVPAPCHALKCHDAGCPKQKHECEFNNSYDGCGGAWDRVNGKKYNDAGGALHAMSWTKKWVRMWLWERKDIPKGLLWSDVSELGKIADGTMEGVYAEWSFENGACDSSEFLDHYYVINLTLCGDWAGKVFSYKGKKGPQACKDYIQNTGPKEWPPLNYDEFPHFLLNSIRLYKVPDLR